MKHKLKEPDAMKNKTSQPADDIEVIVHTYRNMLFRLCLVTLGNANDAEDAVQETLIKYLQKAPRFKKRHPVIDIAKIVG